MFQTLLIVGLGVLAITAIILGAALRESNKLGYVAEQSAAYYESRAISIAEYRRIDVGDAWAAADRARSENDRWRALFGPFVGIYESNQQAAGNKDHNGKTIGVDLDGVIFEYDGKWRGPEKFGAPVAGVREAMKALRELGFHLVVYTTRNNCLAPGNDRLNSMHLTSLVQNELMKHGIPYDEIALMKPLCAYYIDDRAIRFETWPDALSDLSDYEYSKAADVATRLEIAADHIETRPKTAFWESGDVAAEQASITNEVKP